jgi:hypothetical protein
MPMRAAMPEKRCRSTRGLKAAGMTAPRKTLRRVAGAPAQLWKSCCVKSPAAAKTSLPAQPREDLFRKIFMEKQGPTFPQRRGNTENRRLNVPCPKRAMRDKNLFRQKKQVFP